MKTKILAVFIFLCSFLSQAYAADSIKEMFSEGSLNGEIRAYSYTYDYKGTTKDLGDNAVGGLLYYKTAPLHGISFGVAFATANDFFSDSDKDNYLILGSDSDDEHKSVTRLQEYYVKGEWYNTALKYGAQEIDTPMLNGDYCRFFNKTYEGLSVVNKSIDNLTISGYYLTGYASWNADHFSDIVKVLNEDAEDKPMIIGGLTYKIPFETSNVTLDGWVYDFKDVYRSGYFRSNISANIGDYRVSFIPSYFKQDSEGADLAGDFSARQYGFEAGAGTGSFDFTTYLSVTDKDAIVTPFGFGRIVMQQYLISGAAEENVYGAKAAYGFSRLGLNGLSASIWYAYYDRPDTGENAATDVTEIDYTLVYDFGKGGDKSLEGLSVSLGYADMNYTTEEDAAEIKLKVRYAFDLNLKK